MSAAVDYEVEYNNRARVPENPAIIAGWAKDAAAWRERHAPQAIRTYRTEEELRWLTGTGVTAAAVFWARERLDEAGYPAVRIIASSGFGPSKCKLMASVKAPIDVIGTGSYLPERWSETYATADVIAYDGVQRVKIGREFLFRN